MEHDLFAPARDAGLTQGDLAALAGVCRLTANKWMLGRFKPHRLHADKVAALMDRVRTCVEKGDLPVSPRLRGRARHEAVVERINNV